jgi:threonylcarbamoyladenosine tRNA methylthiotransferase MtaB
MADPVPMHKRNERSKMLHILSDKKRRFFYEKHLGNTYPVLWEIENDGSEMFGFTDNYIKVKTPYDPILVNQIMEVTLTSLDEDLIAKCNLHHTINKEQTFNNYQPTIIN